MALIEKYAFRSCDLTPLSGADSGKIEVRGPCYSCSKPLSVTVESSALKEFKSGSFASACFPSLSADRREFLISGICGKCWDELFKESEEEE
jgi:hypothetical protein